VAERYPAVVEDLRAAYETWWSICSRQMAEDIPLSIGADGQEVAVLHTHDLRNADCNVVWNQRQVRQGQPCLGYWEVCVEQTGTYEFDLRRWPCEAGHGLRDGIDGDDVVFRRDAIAEVEWPMYTGGKALDIRTACLEIGSGPQHSVPVGEGDAAVFRVELEAGDTRVRAFFSNNRGLLQSPYYVYVRRLS
jgi:hypothetical protein